jgi:hypothetical protein
VAGHGEPLLRLIVTPVRRAAYGAVATALYLLWTVVVPLVHADTEVLSSAVALEATHAQCATIHAENVCLRGGSFQLPVAGPCEHMGAVPDRPWPVSFDRTPRPARGDRPTQHLVRAPPSLAS